MGYLYELIPPRPDFPSTMTEDERVVMTAHVEYWTGLVRAGRAVAFGPVAGQAGAYGMGVVLADDLDDAVLLRDADPAIASGRGFRTQITPMLSLVTAQGRFDA